jgi:hypothetical protein
MYEDWTSNDWQDRPEAGEGGLAVAERIEAIDVDDEELPKPFLNEYLPTQQEIRRACEEIQRGWTESERRRRRGYRRAHRQPHFLRVVRTAFSG